MSRSCWFSFMPIQVKDPAEVIKLLIKEGWRIQERGEIAYLPIGDDEEFNWQREKIGFEEFFNVVKGKFFNSEIVGVCLLWQDSEIGGELLIHPNGTISFSATINRKTIDPSQNWLDVSWYLERLVIGLERQGLFIEYVKYAESI